MKCFEYKILLGSIDHDVDDVDDLGRPNGISYSCINEQQLNEEGIDGWELVSTSFFPDGQIASAVLKRELLSMHYGKTK